MNPHKKKGSDQVRKDPFILAPLIEEQKKIQREAITLSQKWAVSLVAGGIIILLLAQSFPITGPAAADLVRLGGLFIGSLAALPFREIMHRKERLAVYSFLSDQFRNFESRSHEDRATLLALATDALREALKR